MMCEDPSRNDSRSILWGEIRLKASACHTENLWKPIIAYDNVIKHERTFNSQIDCSENNAFTSEEDEKKLYYDPVGEHIIQLRDYYHELNEIIFERKNIKKSTARTIKARYRKAISGKPKAAKQKTAENLPHRPIPEYPENYPFSDTLELFCKNKPKVRIKCKGHLSKVQAEKQRNYFVKRVLAQTGFYVGDPESDNLPLQYLSEITDMFLEKFITVMHRNKNSEAFCKSDDLWNPLETTLQEIGFGGIRGLHTFYYEKVVKKHDVLLNQCLKLHKEYQKLRGELSL